MPDLINGLFESLGAFFICLSILKLHRDKQVHGVSWIHVTFFAAWGGWNIFFYAHLGQWFSWVGGLGVLAANVVWLAQLIYYDRGNP